MTTRVVRREQRNEDESWFRDVKSGSNRQRPSVLRRVCALERGTGIPEALPFGSCRLDPDLWRLFVDYVREYSDRKWCDMSDDERTARVRDFFRFVLRGLGYTCDAPTQSRFWREHADEAQTELEAHGGPAPSPTASRRSAEPPACRTRLRCSEKGARSHEQR